MHNKYLSKSFYISFPTNSGETRLFPVKKRELSREKTRVSFQDKYQKTYGLILIPGKWECASFC
ncbi:Uncharacterized protein dnm_067970 [Desulfonema magnum]|uniref:Uncharacterized protein n=1 Tax=Desulfonema magnum TaxID=45655 RepID=A0A975BS89_9BACT|nr:Uncharacterized protein dnm_067970 [Desulfonema magnum]